MIEECLRQDKNGKNSLIVAVQKGDHGKVKELLSLGIDPDSKHEGESAASLAYKNKQFDILLSLLEYGAKYPDAFKEEHFNVSAMQHQRLRNFLVLMRDFHKKIGQPRGIDDKQIELLTGQFKNNRFFYSFANDIYFNRSAVYIAHKENKRDLFQALKENLLIANCKEIESMKNDKSTQMKQMNEGSHRNIVSSAPDPIVDSLASLSFFGANLDKKERKSRVKVVCNNFEYLNRSHEIKPVFKFLIRNNCRIIFSFMSSTQELIEAHINHILIDAKHLVGSQSSPVESCCVIARELTRNVVMQMNDNPQGLEKLFRNVMMECESKQEHEPLIKDVFRNSMEVELLACVPQILLKNRDDREKMENLREKFASLIEFYDNRVSKRIEEDKEFLLDDDEKLAHPSVDVVKHFPMNLLEEGIIVKDLELHLKELPVPFLDRIKKRIKAYWKFILAAFIISIIVIAMLISFFTITASPVPHEELETCGRVRSAKLAAGFSYPERWPWLATILEKKSKDDNPKFVCDATLISANHLLTAAHCLINAKPEEYFALIGNLYLTNTVTRLDISQITVHPNYTHTREKYKSYSDIAILRMAQSVNFTDFIQPVCLPHALTSAVGITGVAVGYENSPWSKLKQVKIFTIDATSCIFKYEQYKRIASKQSFCGVPSNNTEAPCFNNSGSGLYVQDKQTGRFKIVGVASLAMNKERCHKSDFVVFVNIVDYIEWIKSVLNGNLLK